MSILAAVRKSSLKKIPKENPFIIHPLKLERVELQDLGQGTYHVTILKDLFQRLYEGDFKNLGGKRILHKSPGYKKVIVTVIWVFEDISEDNLQKLRELVNAINNGKYHKREFEILDYEYWVEMHRIMSF
jgi:hypothetical protein